MNKISIKIKDKKFEVYRTLPYRLGGELNILFMEMIKDSNVPYKEMGNAFKKSPKEMNLDLTKEREMRDLLLTNAVINPNINEEILNDYNHPLQPYLNELSDKLLERALDSLNAGNNEKKKLGT